ncbi:hypothetical protein [Kitasatospora phosalacinea]|uniref:Uncharacterized protein n=1 Tax=Kitasatospora phosalacinea TaxID=2065 RepID=A0A9W6PHM8_9ACTN|nr:hypothetical protein [Kitasatospora phosalacinea]GLW55007.1 hypothetical protein Kpho01_30180 [Kitasatospora phosalacinea]
MDFDQNLADVLTTSVKDLDPPVSEIVAESTRLGREQQRAQRLRTLRVGGASLAVAAVLCAAVVTSRLQDRSAPVRPAPAAPASTAASPSASAPPSALPSTSPAPSALGADARLTPDAMVKLLSDRLPPGGTFVKYQQPYADRSPTEELGAFLRYDDGRGTATFQLTLRKEPRAFPGDSRTPGTLEAPFSCDGGPQRPSGPPPGPLSCRAGFLADGSWEMVRATDAFVPGLYSYQVAVWRPDGDVLVLTEFAGTVGAYGHKENATRAEPPVPLDQWQRIAESPDWQFLVPRALVYEGARLTAGIPRAPFPES